MLKVFSFFIITTTLLTSCNYFNFSKKEKDIIKNTKLKAIKTKGLDLYPEISPCNHNNGKLCFEKQITNKIKTALEAIKISEKTIDKDTIWLNTLVSSTGIISLDKPSSRPLKNSKIYSTIQEIFKQLSPIKPAFISGVPINSSFKIPLVLKTE